MRLLILTGNRERASFRQRIEAYIPLLRSTGIDCEVASLPDNIAAEVRLLRSARRFDGVLLHKKGLNLLEAWVLRCSARRVIYDFDDAIMYKQTSPDVPSGRRMARFARSVRLASLTIAGNEYLAAYARRFGPNVVVLPTGLETARHNVQVTRPDDGCIRLGWIGAMATLPYLQSLIPTFERAAAASRTPVVLRVISDAFPEAQRISVEKCTWSASSQYADLAGCDIGIAPLPDDNFTRGKCGFKVLQYQSAGLPVICSPVGVNSDLVVDGISGYHARGEEDWVRHILRLASDKALRESMGLAGQKAAAAYDMSIIGQRFASLVADCLCGSR
jgi:glycosyltransferase involved in cell wall biosynthesis